MKIRNGFVSNSSSSSFIVSSKNFNGKTTITIDISQFGTLITNENELVDYCIEEYGKYDITNSNVELMLEEIKNGKQVIVGDLDNNLISILDFVDESISVIDVD